MSSPSSHEHGPPRAASDNDNPAIALARRERPTNAIERALLANTRAEAIELTRLSTEYGTAFEVYLEHIWSGLEPIADMEDDFRSLYWGSYDRMGQFIDDQLDANDWLEPIQTMLRAHDMPRDILRWIRTGFAETLKGGFEIVEKDGQIHVFIA